MLYTGNGCLLKGKTMKTRIIRGAIVKRFKEVNQTRPMWHFVINGRIRASYDTLKECREAMKYVQTKP